MTRDFANKCKRGCRTRGSPTAYFGGEQDLARDLHPRNSGAVGRHTVHHYFTDHRIQPLGSARKPLGSAHKPLGGARKPLASACKLLEGAHKPLGGAHEPLGSAHKPLGSAHKPLEGAHKPLGSARKPLGSAHKPLGGTHEPLGSAHTPPPRLTPAAGHTLSTFLGAQLQTLGKQELARVSHPRDLQPRGSNIVAPSWLRCHCTVFG